MSVRHLVSDVDRSIGRTSSVFPYIKPIHPGKYYSISYKTTTHIISSILAENIIELFTITFKIPDSK